MRHQENTGKISRMVSKIVLLMFLTLLVFAVSGCSRHKTEEETAQTSDQDDRLQIGFSFDSFVIERWVRDRDMFVSTAKSLGADVNVQIANGDVEEQISQIEYFIQKKMDVIVLVAIDSESLQEVLHKAKEAGIRILCYDRLVENADADLYISFDNTKVGELMARALIDSCPEESSVFAIYGSPTDNNVNQLEEGFTNTIKDSTLEIVYSNYCDNWLAELAFDYVDEGLEENKEVAGIMCGNDDLASQAIKALSENHLAGEVAVAAQDAELSACQRIVEGTQTMTVYKPVEEEAKAAAILAVALCRGQDITSPDFTNPVTDTISDGTNTIPCYLLDPVAVTKENLDEVIIGSGFHSEDEVYLNVEHGMTS